MREKILEFIEKKLGPFAQKMGNNIYVRSIRDAMLAYMPFTLIGSIFLILAFFPVAGYDEFITNLFGVTDPMIWKSKLIYVNNVTLSIGGLIVVVSLSYNLSDNLGSNTLQVVLTTLVSYLLLVPNNVIDGVENIPINYIGAESIFLGIIVAIVTVQLYDYFSEKNYKIKMPDSVPPAVSGPFESIIPSLLIITLFWSGKIILEIFGNTDALTLINGTIGIPLKAIGGSLFGLVLLKIFSQFLWFFGIHGDSIVNAVIDPILVVLEDQNKLASMNNLEVPNIISLSFKNHFASIGLIGAVLAILIVAKSNQYKEIGKIAMTPYIFNIGEPALFGIPLMLEFHFIMPFIFSNGISAMIAYFAFYFGLVPLPTGIAQMPWTTPIILSGYLVTGSIRGSLLQLVQLVLITLFWIPFIIIKDKEIIKQES